MSLEKKDPRRRNPRPEKHTEIIFYFLCIFKHTLKQHIFSNFSSFLVLIYVSTKSHTEPKSKSFSYFIFLSGFKNIKPLKEEDQKIIQTIQNIKRWKPSSEENTIQHSHPAFIISFPPIFFLLMFLLYLSFDFIFIYTNFFCCFFFIFDGVSDLKSTSQE